MQEKPSLPTSLAMERDIYTISRLNREARALLEGRFPLIWVEGEISNLTRPSSGHLYFTLKDAEAQVRCAMFRMKNMHLGFNPQNGMQVLVRARVSLYEPRGDYQLIAETMEAAGAGALRRAFEQLKQRLAAAGLFEAAHKKPLPALPKRIGVITSPTGAAIRDILTTLHRRFPAIPVLIYPVPVQGAEAAPAIVSALQRASHQQQCDVLILARGGGSLEDLWPFNEESVARAIYDCQIPVVTGIGHEIDFTIADFVADQRAPTPTAAAELVAPDQRTWQQNFLKLEQRLKLELQRRLQLKAQTLGWLEKRLQQHHPGLRLTIHSQRLDELEQRLQHARRVYMRHLGAKVAELSAHLHRYIPVHRLEQMAARTENLSQRLKHGMQIRLERQQQRLITLGRALDAVSPLATLDRGYAIVRRLPDQAIVRSITQLKAGARVETKVADGRLLCTVTETVEN